MFGKELIGREKGLDDENEEKHALIKQVAFRIQQE